MTTPSSSTRSRTGASTAATTAAATAASDLLGMLRKHYLPENREPAGLFAPEIASPDGRRRADLIWVPITHAGARQDSVVGHEIKVTRADLMTELRDPAKADPWAQHCSRWWLVVPDPALIDGLEIPEAWGVMCPPSGRRTRSMTVLQPAPRLTPTGDPASLITRLAGFVVHRVEHQTRVLESELAQVVRGRDHLRQTVSQLNEAGSRPTAASERVARVVAAVEQQSRLNEIWAPLDEEAIVTAILDATATRAAARRARQDIHDLIRQVRAITEPFKGTDRALAVAMSAAGVLDEGLAS